MKRQFILLVILIEMSCSPYLMYFQYDYKLEKAENIRSIVITPIDMIRARPKGTDVIQIRKLEDKIEDYLRSNGYIIEQNGLLVENWQKEAEKANGFFDPTTGRIDGLKISICLQKAIEKTRGRQDFEGVMFIQLIERPAKLMGDRVYWDGVSRRLLNNHKEVITDITWRGEMKALSLQVQLFDKAHKLIFQNIGAIEFPYELEESHMENQFVWKRQIQFKDEEIIEGMHIAFHPLVRYRDYPEKPNFYEE